MLVLLMYTLLSIFGARLSNSVPKFHVITKCSSKLDCLVKEMLYIRMRKPTLNVQTDSIRAKVFV